MISPAPKSEIGTIISTALIMLAMAPAQCFISNRLQTVIANIRQSKFIKSASAFLLAGLVLFLAAAGASPSLHKLIHSDAGAPDHSCVITTFSKGQVDAAPAAPILVAFVLLFGGVGLLAENFLLPSADYRFSSSRAPPSRFA
jgi:hypothetical protein